MPDQKTLVVPDGSDLFPYVGGSPPSFKEWDLGEKINLISGILNASSKAEAKKIVTMVGAAYGLIVRSTFAPNIPPAKAGIPPVTAKAVAKKATKGVSKTRSEAWIKADADLKACITKIKAESTKVGSVLPKDHALIKERDALLISKKESV